MRFKKSYLHSPQSNNSQNWKRSKNLGFLFLFGSFCTSCMTMPVAEKRPTYTFEETWKHTSDKVSYKNEAPITNDSWWKIYQDPILDELIEKGIQNSPTMEKAFARFDEASWYTRVTGSDQFPQLSLNGYGDRRRLPKSLRTETQVPTGKMLTPKADSSTSSIQPPVPAPNTGLTPIVIPAAPAVPQMTTVSTPKFVNDLIANFFISYEIDFWGKYYLRTEAAKARAEASQDDIETARLILVDQIVATYFTIQSLNKEISYIQDEIDLHRKKVSLLEEQYVKGLKDRFLFLQEQAALELKVADKHARIKTRDNNLSLLAVLLGEQPNSTEIQVSEISWSFPLVPAGLPSSLLAKRPDIKSAMKEVDALISEIGAAKAELLPSFSLSAAAGYQAGKANEWFKWKNRVWSAAAQVSQPIFDAGRRIAEVEATKARYRQAAANLTDTVLSAVKEVEDALVLIRTQEERCIATTNKEKDFTLIAHLRKDLFATGVQDFLLVLQAEEDRIQAKRDLVNEEYNLQLGTLSLIKSLGGSW